MINPFPVFHNAEIILLNCPCENKDNNVCLSYSPDIFSNQLKKPHHLSHGVYPLLTSENEQFSGKCWFRLQCLGYNT